MGHEKLSDSNVLGIVGVGHLATYVVDGLRHVGDNRRIVISPRNADRARDLQRHHGCEVAQSNQEVADLADIVLLATRPDKSVEALAELDLRADQLIVSVAAGLALDPLLSAAAPAVVTRAMPVCCAEIGEGAIPIYPYEARAQSLLGRIGAVVSFSEERQFEQATVAACVNGWFFQLFAELENWLTQAGLDAAQARALMLHAARGATGLALYHPDQDLNDLATTIASPGTYTRLGLDVLRERQALGAWSAACDEVLQKPSDSG